MKKILSKKRVSLAVLITFLFYLFYPPLSSLSQLGLLTISPNKNIQNSEIPEYIYEHVNKDFSAYFGKSDEKEKTYINFQTQSKSIELELLQKTSIASLSALPQTTPTPLPTPTPTTQDVPADTTPEEQSTISAGLQSELQDIQQSLASISGKIQEVSSTAGEIAQEVKNIIPLEIIREQGADGDTLTFKNADENTDYKITPELDSLKQNIRINSSIYKWPLQISLNVNGLLVNQSPSGEFQFTDQATNNPVLYLNSFRITSESSGESENLVAKYAIDNSKFVLELTPSETFLNNYSIKPPFNIEYYIKPAVNAASENNDTAKYKGVGNVISSQNVKMQFSETDKDYKYTIDRSDFKAKLFDKSGNYNFYFEKDGKSVRFTIPNQSSQNISLSKTNSPQSSESIDSLEVKDIVSGKIDVRYKPLINGIKEEIILNDASILSSLQNEEISKNGATYSGALIPIPFTMELNGLKAEEDSGGIIHFVDTSTNVSLFRIEKPYAVDANNIKTDNVFFRMNNNILTTIIDKNWLEDPTRVFPIIIDPTVTLSGVASYTTASNYSFQRKSWYDGTRYWIAFQNGTASGAAVNFYYSTNNGASWTINSSASLTDAVTYSESIVEDTNVDNLNTSGTTAFTGLKCDRVQAGISGKIAKVAYYVGANEVSFTASVKQESASSCSSPGASIPTDVYYTNYLTGVATVNFAGEGTPIAKGSYYCVCLNFIPSKIWYGTSATDHYKRVWVRPLNADFSVEGDETNAYIIYRDWTTDKILVRRAASYPGTSFSWGTATQIWQGGTGGADGEVRLDMPNIAQSSGKVYFTARKSTYAGTTISDYSTRSNNPVVSGLTNNWEVAKYMPVNPTQDGTLDKVDVTVVTNSNAATDLYAKLCYDVADLNCTAIDSVTITSPVISGLPAKQTIDFPNNPYVSQEKRYRILFHKDQTGTDLFLRGDVGYNSLVSACATDTNCLPAANGIGIGLRPRSLVQIVGKRAALDLTSLENTFSVRPSSGNNANMANQIIPGLGASVGKILFLFQDGTSLKWFTFDGSSTYSSEAALASLTTPNNLTQIFSGAASSDGSFIVTYIDSSGHLHSRTLASDLTTWGSEEDIDTNTDNIYVTTSLGQGSNTFFTAWFRSSQNSTIYFARRPVSIPQWSSAQSLNTSAAGSLHLSSLLISSEQIAIIRTVGTSEPYNIVTDMIDTGLTKQMRHGRTFENETKQPAAY